jgi:hypothetical protein
VKVSLKNDDSIIDNSIKIISVFWGFEIAKPCKK